MNCRESNKDGLSRRDFMHKISLVAVGAIAGALAAKCNAQEKDSKETQKILSYNPDMRYRRLGKTGLMVSEVCLGGHWKRIAYQPGTDEFHKNRCEVVNRCMEVGINHIDACTYDEVMSYSKALKGCRDKMTFSMSDYQREVRNEQYRTSSVLLETLDRLLKDSGEEYTDLWRITCHEPGGKHDFNTSCEIVDALEKAKKQGKARFIGISSHDRRWLKFMIEYFPQIDVILTPYTADSKVAPQDSLFDAVKKCDVGIFGIKPFASNSLFKGSSNPDDPNYDEDNKRARLAIRYILCNPDITAPIPGLIRTDQVDNMAKAIKERTELDVKERAELKRACKEMWANLAPEYKWLKNWEYV